MKIKTSELTGAALDWAVAKCEGHDWMPGDVRFTGAYAPRYSTDWRQGGPIIERERIGLWWAPHYVDGNGKEYGDRWYAEGTGAYGNSVYAMATTALEAAMRCYVASKLGDDVDVPEGL